MMIHALILERQRIGPLVPCPSSGAMSVDPPSAERVRSPGAMSVDASANAQQSSGAVKEMSEAFVIDLSDLTGMSAIDVNMSRWYVSALEDD